MADVIAALKQVQQRRRIGPGKFVMGFGYDPDLLAEKRAPTKQELDATFPDNPVILVHVSGQGLGDDERITPLEALEAITIDGARMYGEEARKGSIEPGKVADLVVLSANPLTVPPAEIERIRVTETIKEGKTVWPRRE